MFLNYIELNDFNCFEGFRRFEFGKLNLLKGRNGSGKSTVGLDAFLFAVYGYTDKTLQDLPTRWVKAPKCSVKVGFEYLGDNWEIKRSIPTKIEIMKNGVPDTHETSADKQKFLNDLFKNVDYFRKFRMLDIKQGINILEQGKVALKKTLMSFNEDIFNSKRTGLLEKKREREIYNKDTAVVSPHYPSEKRYDVICEGIANLIDKIEQVDKDLRDVRSQSNKEYGNFVQARTMVAENNNKISRLRNLNSCPTCYQSVPKEHKDRIIEELNIAIEMVQNDLTKYQNAMNDSKEQESMYEGQVSVLRQQQVRLNNARTRIETRLKQKDYKYTNRDVFVISEAIKQLDKFISGYITDWIKGLEPIINNIVEKVNLEVHFLINEKNEFDIVIKKDGVDYGYKDLSDGQRLMLSIAFQGALLIQEGEEGLIIADEGFSSLDDENLRHVIDLFNDLPFQLVFILHRAPQVPEFVKIIDLEG